jgi:hypothetical protein
MQNMLSVSRVAKQIAIPITTTTSIPKYKGNTRDSGYAHEQIPCPDYFETRVVHDSSHTGQVYIS